MPTLPPIPPNDEDEPGKSKPAIPPAPRDLFTRLGPTMDRVRGTIAKLGLRPYRSFIVRELTDGPERGKGEASLHFDEIVPSPVVITLSAVYIAGSGGRYEEGAVRLEKVTRSRRLEELQGRTLFGDDPAKNLRILYGLKPRGQMFVKLYRIASEPRLEPLGWVFTLNPVNRPYVQSPVID